MKIKRTSCQLKTAIEDLESKRLMTTDMGLECDFNQDGHCNLVDLDSATGLYSAGDISEGVVVSIQDAHFDLNNDGLINLSDLESWLTEAAFSEGFDSAFVAGDTDLDGDVDFGDFLNTVELVQREDFPVGLYHLSNVRRDFGDASLVVFRHDSHECSSLRNGE